MNITENMRGNFVALHILRPTVAVNLNAGKDGTPKSIRYGGVVRQRVSSQAIKRAIRVSMRERLNDEDTARRTKGIPGAVADQVMHLARRSGDELDRDDVRLRLEQAEGERTESRTDLDDVRVLFKTRGGDDRAHGIGVDDEVLALLLRRAQTDVSG